MVVRTAELRRRDGASLRGREGLDFGGGQRADLRGRQHRDLGRGQRRDLRGLERLLIEVVLEAGDLPRGRIADVDRGDVRAGQAARAKKKKKRERERERGGGKREREREGGGGGGGPR